MKFLVSMACTFVLSFSVVALLSQTAFADFGSAGLCPEDYTNGQITGCTTNNCLAIQPKCGFVYEDPLDNTSDILGCSCY